MALTEKQKWSLVVCGCVVPLVTVGVLTVVLAAVGALLFATSEDLPVTDDDRLLVVMPEDLAEFFDLQIDPSKAVIKKTRYFDSSWDVDLEYENDGIFLNSSMTTEVSVSDAAMSFTGMKTGLKIGLGWENVDFTSEPSPLKGMDATEYTVFVNGDGESFGQSLIARKGLRVFVLVLAGAVLDDPNELLDLCAGPISRLDDSVEPNGV